MEFAGLVPFDGDLGMDTGYRRAYGCENNLPVEDFGWEALDSVILTIAGTGCRPGGISVQYGVEAVGRACWPGCLVDKGIPVFLLLTLGPFEEILGMAVGYEEMLVDSC